MNEDLKNRDSVEEQMDDLFRKALHGHRVEPDPVLWKGISRKLLWLEIKRLNFSNLTIKHWSTAILTVMLTGLAVYFGLPDMSKTIKDTKSANPSAVLNEAQITEASETHTSHANPVEPAKTVGSGTEPKQVVRHPDNEIGAKSPATTKSKALVYQSSGPQKSKTTGKETLGFVPEDSEVINGLPGQSPATSPLIRTMESYIAFIEPYRIDKIDQKPGIDTIITIRTIRGDEKFAVKKSTASQMFSVCFGINPEWSFYRGEEDYIKMNYWAQGGVSYHYSRFSVTSGVGLGYMLDNGNYKVDYKSEDSVGFYSNVVSYTVGTNNEILFNSQDKTIYDSLMHQEDYRTSNRYTYLRIPLLFGYRVFESNKFNVSVQAGPAISFLLGERKSDPVIEYPNARIIRIDEETPARMKTNWQLWANLMVEMRITRKIGIYLEPSFKYYMKPTAEQENSEARPPWSLGLGFGLQFNFEQKK